jgi:hypothetical protein
MIFPKKPQLLYAPMLGTLGGGSMRSFGRGTGSKPLKFTEGELDLARFAAEITPSTTSLFNTNFTSGGMFVDQAGNHIFLFDGSTVRRYNFGQQHVLSTLGTSPSTSWSSSQANRAMEMDASGTKSFHFNETSQDLYTYSHSGYNGNSWNGAGSTYFNATSNEAYPHTIRFDSTGTKFIVHWYSGTNNLHYYTTTSSYDIGAANRQSVGGGVNAGTRDIAVSDDGTVIMWMQPGVPTLYAAYMSTPWDVSTMYGTQTVSYFITGFNVHGLIIRGDHLYIAGENKVHQYTVG